MIRSTGMGTTHKVDEVVGGLRGQILAGQLVPDDLLPSEGKLGESYGVSRTVVREAMQTLRAQGLVEVSRGRRARVRRADPQHMVDSLGAFLERSDHTSMQLLEVRRELEAGIAALAAQRATPPQINAMKMAIQQQRGAGSLEEQIDADIHFHNLLAKAAANPVFEMLLTTLAGSMRRSRRTTISRVGTQRAIAGHLEILDSIRQADSEAAREAMLKHLAMAEEDLQAEHE